MPLEWLFGRRMSPDEMLRKNQRALNKAMRDLDRENMRMEQQEKKIIQDIKKMAKDGQMVSRCCTRDNVLGVLLDYGDFLVNYDFFMIILLILICQSYYLQ